MKSKKHIVLLVLFSAVLNILICGNSFARETWEAKALAEGVYNCYYATSSKGDYIITNRMVMDDMDSINDLIGSNNENFVPLITGKYKINDNGLSCRQLFAGYKGTSQSFDGLLGTLSTSTILKTTERESILKKMGYKPNLAANSGGECFVLKYKYFEKRNGEIANENEKETQQICTPSSNSKVTDIVISGEKGQIFFKKDKNKLTLKIPKNKVDWNMFDSNTEDVFDLANYSSIADLRSAIVSAASARFPVQYDGSTALEYTTGFFLDFSPTNATRRFDYGESSGLEYTFGGYSDDNTLNSTGRTEAFRSATSNLIGSGVNYYDDLKYNSSERILLYKYYIQEFYKADYDCSWRESPDATEEAVKAQGYTIIQPENGSGSCIIKATNNKSSKVNGLNSDGHFSNTQYSLEQIAVILGSESNIDIEEELEKPTSGIEDGGVVDDGGGSAGPCWNSGLESMAWVACPIEANLTGFARGVSGLIDGWMEIDSELYNNESEAKIIWGYIRTIANTALIGILAFIIFSQITGYGIDNYGIKKTLPKLIVTIVLINLSFIICQLAIDLSNTLGHGIESLFYGLGNNLVETSARPADSMGILSDFIGGLVATLYSVAGVGATVTGMLAVATGSGANVMTVVLILLLLLTIVVAVLLFFISIGARTIIIIMCAALSPLAFVFYALPNTKQIYKKWFDAFKAALIIYPICGAVLGASYVLKAIAVTQTNIDFPMLMVVGIAPYLPFFMIPAMLKGAINTLGTVGAALSTMGSTFRNGVRNTANGASGLIKDSAAYKAAQGEANRKRQINWANRVKNRMDRRMDEGKNLSRNQQRMRAMAQHTLDKQETEDTAVARSMLDSQFKNASIGDLASELSGALSTYNGTSDQRNRINALTDLMISRGGASGASAIARVVRGEGEYSNTKINRDNLSVLRDHMSANKDFGNFMRNKSGSTYDAISSLGDRDHMGMAYSIRDGSLSSVKDWSSQGAAEIARATNAMSELSNMNGPLSQQQTDALENYRNIVQQVLTSNDPSIQSGILGNTEKRNAWEDAARRLGVNIPGRVVANNNSTNRNAQEGQSMRVPHNRPSDTASGDTDTYDDAGNII